MANTFEMSGKVKVVFEPMTFASGFMKREFVVTMEDDYPQDVKFVCVKEKCALLDGVQAGSDVKVSFRIRGNLYKDRYFVDLQAFRVDIIAGVEPADSDMPWGTPSTQQDDEVPPF
jgi:single-strand DNA-binding protein